MCIKYLDGECKRGDECPAIHACYAFLANKCKKQEGVCEYKHASAFDGPQAQRLVNDFHLSHGELRHSILLPTWKKELERWNKSKQKDKTKDTEGEILLFLPMVDFLARSYSLNCAKKIKK